MLEAKIPKISAKDLNPSELRIISKLREGSATVIEMSQEFKVTYHAVKRPLDALVSKGFVEVDQDQSGFSKSKFYKIKRLPSDGIEVEINVGGELKTMSFNTYLEATAKAIARGDTPKVGSNWPTLPTTQAYLATYAAHELENPGAVNDAQLLKVRSPLQKYAFALQEEYRRVMQLLTNEALWQASSLKEGVLVKTDRYLTPDEARDYARMIFSRFNPEMMAEVTEVTETNETDEDNETSEKE